MRELFLLFALLVAIAADVDAEEVTELYLDAGTCWLRERGVAIKKDPVSVRGRKEDDGCRAFIVDDEFNRRFKSCFYSGFFVSAAPNASWYGCGISREHKSFMFEARMDKDKPGPENIECKYMCYVR